MRRHRVILVAPILAGLAPVAAEAGQTAYQYDAQGRLVQVVQSGGSANYQAQYVYDKADNRTSRVVTGAGGRAAIIPKNGGYRVIPINP